MTGEGLSSIEAGLGSDSPEHQVEALELSRELFGRIAREAVAALARGPNRFLIAERLPWLGSPCIEPLESLLTTTEAAEEARALAALVLLQVGSLSGVELLLKIVQSDSEYCGLAATHLAAKEIPGADAVILDRLLQTDPEEVDRTVMLIDALKRLDRPLPRHLIERYQRDDAPWQLRALFRGH